MSAQKLSSISEIPKKKYELSLSKLKQQYEFGKSSVATSDQPIKDGNTKRTSDVKPVTLGTLTQITLTM